MKKEQKITAYPQYRDFNTMTDEEIDFICKEILSMKEVTEIERYDNEIEVSVLDEWVDEETNERNEIEDNITLTPNEIKTYSFSLLQEESMNYKKYLFALGMDWRLKDNPYLQ